MQIIRNRRSFLAGLSAVGTAGLLKIGDALAAEPPIETTTVRIADFPGSVCTAPQYVAEELLRQDGFSDVQQISTGDNTTTTPMFEADKVDFGLDFATALALTVDKERPMKALAGVHVGCYVLFAQEGIDSVLDLKGRSVGIGPQLGTDPHLFVTVMATYVGLNAAKDINWVISDVTPTQLFEEGKIDALMTFPPESQELRRRKVGHVIVNSMIDKPWSQYFCCMLVARPAYVQKYPVATKRVIRAILKATDLCISDPQRVAGMIVEKGYVTPEQYDDTVASLSEIPYKAWREYDPEDTVRFFALRLHEAGMIKSSPQKIIADGTDWSFLNEVKRELKA
jgi:NitT/TauT family transport system substrate-binding protein